MTNRDPFRIDGPAVIVGDQLRFSVALLREIYEMPDHASGLVTVKEIRVENDGAKLLVLERYESYTWAREEH